MRKIGELWEEEGFVNFSGFKAMNIGRPLVVSLQPLPLILVGIYYGRSSRETIWV